MKIQHSHKPQLYIYIYLSNVSLLVASVKSTLKLSNLFNTSLLAFEVLGFIFVTSLISKVNGSRNEDV